MAEVIDVMGSMVGRSGLEGGAWWIPLREVGTKAWRPATELGQYVDELMDYAEAHPECTFEVLEYSFPKDYPRAEIGKLFSMVSPNVHLPPELAPFCKGIRGPYGMKSG